MYKPVNELNISVRELIGIMEDWAPKDKKPRVSFGVQFLDRERKAVWLMIQQKMVYKICIFEDSFPIQIYELIMDFVGNEIGIVISDSRGLSWSKNW